MSFHYRVATVFFSSLGKVLGRFGKVFFHFGKVFDYARIKNFGEKYQFVKLYFDHFKNKD